MTNGKEHAWQRKMLNPAFSFSSLMSFVEVFDANTDNLIKVDNQLHLNSVIKASCATGMLFGISFYVRKIYFIWYFHAVRF